MLLRIVGCLLVLSASASADVAFAIQPTVGVGTAVDPVDTSVASTASSVVPREAFRMVPALRIGVDLGSWMMLAYGSNSTAGVQGHQVNGLTRAGILFEPVVWRSDDERVRLYVVAGGGIAAISGTSVSVDAMGTVASSFSSAGATFIAGVGGSYTIHPSFAIGLEIAVEPDVISLDSGTYVANQTVVSLTGTFVTRSSQTPARAADH